MNCKHLCHSCILDLESKAMVVLKKAFPKWDVRVGLGNGNTVYIHRHLNGEKRQTEEADKKRIIGIVGRKFVGYSIKFQDLIPGRGLSDNDP